MKKHASIALTMLFVASILSSCTTTADDWHCDWLSERQVPLFGATVVATDNEAYCLDKSFLATKAVNNPNTSVQFQLRCGSEPLTIYGPDHITVLVSADPRTSSTCQRRYTNIIIIVRQNDPVLIGKMFIGKECAATDMTYADIAATIGINFTLGTNKSGVQKK